MQQQAAFKLGTPVRIRSFDMTGEASWKEKGRICRWHRSVTKDDLVRSSGRWAPVKFDDGGSLLIPVEGLMPDNRP